MEAWGWAACASGASSACAWQQGLGSALLGAPAPQWQHSRQGSARHTSDSTHPYPRAACALQSAPTAVSMLPLIASRVALVSVDAASGCGTKCVQVPCTIMGTMWGSLTRLNAT
jgi:hypothetical protein